MQPPKGGGLEPLLWKIKIYTEAEKAVMRRFDRYMDVVINRRVHNVVRDYLRKMTRSNEISLDDLDESEYGRFLATEDLYESDTEGDVIFRINNVSVGISSDTLLKILKCLTQKELATLILSVGMECKADEVAKILNLSNSRVHSYKSSALRKARKSGREVDGNSNDGRLRHDNLCN